jgi:hypothetical protein
VDNTCLTYSQIVDFCCGANDFSVEVRRKLILAGKKNCEYKNFDILAPKVNLCMKNPSERGSTTTLFCYKHSRYSAAMFIRNLLHHFVLPVQISSSEWWNHQILLSATQLVFRATNLFFILFVTRMLLNLNNETGFQYSIANFLSVTSWWVLI